MDTHGTLTTVFRVKMRRDEGPSKLELIAERVLTTGN